MVHFRFHSQTQRVVHIAPFLLSIFAAFWWDDKLKNEFARASALFAVGWLFLENFLINILIRRYGTRIGPLDFSKNTHPTSVEKLLMWLMIIATVVAGPIAAIYATLYITRGGTEMLVLGGVCAFFFAAVFTYLIPTFAIIVLSGFRIRPVRN